MREPSCAGCRESRSPARTRRASATAPRRGRCARSASRVAARAVAAARSLLAAAVAAAALARSRSARRAARSSTRSATRSAASTWSASPLPALSRCPPPAVCSSARPGPLDRPDGRLEAAARRLHRSLLVAARPLRRRRARARAARARPDGTVRWSLARPGTVACPRWSPDGYRIAYLAGTLRVVAGDGTGDHGSPAARTHVAPAWRPGPAGTCSPRRRERRRPPRRRRQRPHLRLPRWTRLKKDTLAWTHNGRYLISVSNRSRLTVIGRSGRPAATFAIPARPPRARSSTPNRHIRARRQEHGRPVDRHNHRPPRAQDETRLLRPRPLQLTRLVARRQLARARLAERRPDSSSCTRPQPPGDPRRLQPQPPNSTPPRRSPRFPSLGGWCCTTKGQS